MPSYPARSLSRATCMTSPRIVVRGAVARSFGRIAESPVPKSSIGARNSSIDAPASHPLGRPSTSPAPRAPIDGHEASIDAPLSKSSARKSSSPAPFRGGDASHRRGGPIGREKGTHRPEQGTDWILERTSRSSTAGYGPGAWAPLGWVKLSRESVRGEGSRPR